MKAMEMVDVSLAFIERNRRWFRLVRSADEIDGERINIILGVEGGHIFDQDLRQVKVLYNLGVRVFTLTWNNSNRLAHSALADDRRGVTGRGFDYLRQLSRLGVIIDLSHASTRTVLDVCRVMPQPPIASHSCLRSLHGFKRNISDRALAAIGRRGGVCGVNFSAYHLGGHSVVDHLAHIKRRTSIRHAAIGTDFDGINDPIVPDAGHFPKVLREIVRSDFRPREIEQVLWGNFLRVFKQVC